jgi:hypothetical protein
MVICLLDLKNDMDLVEFVSRKRVFAEIAFNIEVAVDIQKGFPWLDRIKLLISMLNSRFFDDL